MAAPGEHKTVQARILHYAQEIGWTYVPRAEAERRRGFDPAGATPAERARTASLYFGDLLHTQIRAFNPKYKEAEGALIGQFQRFHADIYGNRDFLQALRNQHKFFCAEENLMPAPHVRAAWDRPAAQHWLPQKVARAQV
ncbi:MAG: hypothetical protein AAB325_04290 [Pseudomonadota bacterium]|mgnify:CR=1 FL=1